MTNLRIDNALVELKDIHETAHRQVDRDERGIPINSEHMRRASDANVAGLRLNRLGRNFMFRAMEIEVRVAASPCVCHPMDAEDDKCLGDIAREALADLTDAILGEEGT